MDCDDVGRCIIDHKVELRDYLFFRSLRQLFYFPDVVVALESKTHLVEDYALQGIGDSRIPV